MAKQELAGAHDGPAPRSWLHPLHCTWLLLGAVHCTAVIGGGSQGTTGQGPNGTAAGSSAGTGGAANPNGTGGSGAGTSASTGGSIGDSTLKTFTCATSATPDPGPSPLRLLSRAQYQNTLSGLFKTVPNLDTMLGAADTYPTAFGLAQAGIDQVTLPHNNLLVSVANAMGFPDVTTFGIPGCCTGALPNLTA